MDCIFKITDELRNGRPLYRCDRKGCNNVSDSDKHKAYCRHPSANIPLGDIVKTGIAVATAGVSLLLDCGGCKKRQMKWNEAGEIPLPSFLVKASDGTETTNETTDTNRNGEHDPQGP